MTNAGHATIGEQAIDTLLASSLARLAASNAVRERALADCRKITRLSANSIRAVHRQDFAAAGALFAEAADLHDALADLLAGHPEVKHAGFFHDAEKELVEAAATAALCSGEPVPGPEALRADPPAYLNGLAEAVGELRRAILDQLRRGEPDGCEAKLDAMDDIYSALMAVDYPDAMTGGLRRTMDATRGVVEKTRGDLTLALIQLRAAGR